ncbi:MAG: sugar ABC transporter ATP-binding protein, partial [Candidatus Solibacter sp.]|nr:sugar ABC transporter ATP-binding protein [Candidatus Solibacter sp.]
ENIFLGRERTRYGLIERREQERLARGLMDRLEQPIDPGALVGGLPLGQQQIVEIAKALAQELRVLIMDEPTSALSRAEIEILFRLIRDLKAHGLSIVYISHRMEELLVLGDRVTVLRDGRVVAQADAAAVSVPWIVEKMTGRTSAPSAALRSQAEGRVTLAVDDLDGISFTAHAGEIVGFYGLLGAGRTELFETLIGLRRARASGGSIRLEGKPLHRLDVADRIARGIVLVPEERQAAGIVAVRSVLENMMLGVSGGWYVSPQREHRSARELVRGMSIRLPGLDHPISELSGGNPQKVVLARALLRAPKVLLLDEPTRGVDVGAREEIYSIIRDIAAEGRTVLFSSSELQEVLALATRVIVLSQGRIQAEFSAAEATEQALVAATGGKHGHC